jgi:dihydrofolate reductase
MAHAPAGRHEEWTGWWGAEPPYHAPVYVLTHHRHDPIQMDGGTTFHFVTDELDAAYSAAREAAGNNGVDIAGGASTVRQALIAGVVDDLTHDIAPVLLGSGERIFDGAILPVQPDVVLEVVILPALEEQVVQSAGQASPSSGCRRNRRTRSR